MNEMSRMTQYGKNPMIMILLLAAVFGAARPTKAQGTCLEAQAATDVIDAGQAQPKSRFPTGTPLRATPAPDLDDELVFLETRGKALPETRVLPIRFYRITISHYVLKEDTIQSFATQLDADSEWIAAFDTKGRTAYFMAGSSDPVGGFNQLVKALHMDIKDANVALDVFDSYLKYARPEIRADAISDDMKLERVAIEDFGERYPRDQSRAAFDRWWKAVPLSLREKIAAPVAVPSDGRFAVRYFYYDRGAIWKLTALIAPDGTVSDGKPQVLTGGGEKAQASSH